MPAWDNQRPAAIPFYYSTRGLLYNKSIFDMHEVDVPSGLEYPSTMKWDDLIPILKDVHDPPNHYGLGFSIPTAYGRGHLFSVARGYGAEVCIETSEFGKFYCDLDSDAGEDTFAFYGDAVNEHGITPPECLEWGPMDRNYATGVVSTCIGLGPWVVETMATVGEDALDNILNTGVTHVPTDDGTPADAMNECPTFLLLNTGYQPEMGWKFLSEYLCTADRYLQLMEWPTTIPGGDVVVEEYGLKTVQLLTLKEGNTRAGVYDHWWFKDWYQISLTGRRRPANPWGKPGQFCVDHLTAVVRQEESPADAAAAVAEETNDYFKDNDLYGE
jgi:hypothetical protein